MRGMVGIERDVEIKNINIGDRSTHRYFFANRGNLLRATYVSLLFKRDE